MNTPIPAPSSPDVEATPFDGGALYDLVCGSIDFDLAFDLGLAKAARGPVLEVACGTGRILLPCLQAGVDIEGLDLFPAMVTRLREKATALGLDPALHQADMAALRLPRRFALIMIPFNAFPHNLTTDAQKSAMIVRA